MARQTRKSASRNRRSRLLAWPKLSDYQVEKIVRLFAAGESAAAAHRQTTISYVSVRRLYELIRRRLIEVGLFAPEGKALSFALAEDDEDAHDDDLAAIQPALGRRRGATARTKPDHIAELLFRQVDDRLVPKPTPAHRARAQAQLQADIMRIIRLTGPLNRPPEAAGLDRARIYVLERFTDLQMQVFFRGLPAWRREVDAYLDTIPPPPPQEAEPIEAERPVRVPLGRIPKRAPDDDPADPD